MTTTPAEVAGPPLLRPGDVVLGLEIRRLCGAGGFGSVYEAFDPALRRAVALKVLHRRDPAVLRRFRDEGRSLARLSHPHIVQVYAVDALPDGTPALLMQFVPGGSLADHLTPGVPLPPSTSAEIVGDLLEALTAAHAAGICHRDVKPANVLWHPGARAALLCDFGIARLVDAPPSEPTAGLVGSRQSLAPERLRGVADDPRSDLFATGALLYRLLSGVDPFDVPGGDLLALAERMTRPPPAPPHVPAGLARLCTALLAHEPAHRPSAAEARLMLRAALRISDTEDAPAFAAAPARPDPTAPPSSSARPPLRLAVGLIAGVVAAAAAFALLARPDVAPSRPTSPTAASPSASPPSPIASIESGGSGPASANPTPAPLLVAPPTTAPVTRPQAPEIKPRDRRARNTDALERPFVEPSP